MRVSHLSPFGVEVSGLDDLSAASAEQIAEMVAAMQSDAGCGVLVVRGQQLSAEAHERALFRFAPHFGAPIRYDRWPGQSKGVEGRPHLSLRELAQVAIRLGPEQVSPRV